MESGDRKLTALLSADVAGYTRLMGDDDRATLETLSAYRTVFFESVARFGGRIVNAPGDAILAEFGSVVYALDCALAIQNDLSARNAQLSLSRRMDFRIGISLGDVLVRHGELYGDGVNLAARVQSLAHPGGICITSKVFYEIDHRLAQSCVSLGKRKLKNIPEPVVVYRVLREPKPGAALAERARYWLAHLSRRGVIGAAALAVLAVLVFGVWRLYPGLLPELNIELPSDPLALPQVPSLAVLPIANLSGDTELEWFSDGITETLITDLANLNGLFVIARNSVFHYKGKAVDPRVVGRELGVRYLLEGSLQRAGGQMRVGMQLIEAQTARNLWAERFDVALDDIFKVQDQIARRVVTELDANLLAGDQARIWRRTTDNPKAYNLYLRGLAAHDRYTREDLGRAQQLYEQALALDPDFAIALVQMGWVHLDNADQGWTDDPAGSRLLAESYARTAIAADILLGDAHALLGNLLAAEGLHALAVAEFEQALALNPSSAENLVLVGWGLAQHGRAQEGLALVQKGMRLDPISPHWYQAALGEALIFQDRFEEAAEAYQRCANQLSELIWCYAGLVVAKVELGKVEEARPHAQELLRLKPGFLAGKNFYIAQIGPPEARERAIRAFKAAGLE